MKLIDKFKTKQFGVLLIIVGVFIPSVLYPFATISTKGLSYGTSTRDLEIVLVKAEYGAAPKNVITSEELFEEQAGTTIPLKDVVFDKAAITIPYKYPVALGVLLVFVGSCFVVLFKNNNVIYL